MLECKRLHPTARAPVRASEGAAGYDLSWCASQQYKRESECAKDSTWSKWIETSVDCLQPLNVRAHDRLCLSTGLILAIPEGHYGRIAPRSGLARKGLDVVAGVVDADYRGELMVMIHWTPPKDCNEDSIRLDDGDRIAQLILEKISTPEVRMVEELTVTSRGDGAFGSTGVKRLRCSDKI